jgi:deazaflavin-dependent oxidoreductase (nitroreductase family)
MTQFDPAAWENALIEHMRANGGEVTEGPLAGHPLLVLTSTGAKSGQPRRAILTYSRDGDDYVVAGTAGGSPTVPSWVANVAAHPHATIETGARTFEIDARVVTDDAERQRLWDRHVERLPWFGEYPEKSGRVIPVIRLTPSNGSTSAKA